MKTIIKLFSPKKGEINKFLSKFYNTSLNMEDSLKFKKEYSNPIEIAEIIGVFIDNDDDYDIKMWVSLDKDVYININNSNANNVIKYLFERYPY